MFRKKNFSKVGALLIVVFVLTLLWQRQGRPLAGEVVVSYDGNAFIPEKIVVKKGARVIFRNSGSKDFWPASDFHPDNGVYPALNPKRPLEPGQLWEFIFEETGEWGYHNHLYALHKGTVLVKSESFFSLSNECANVKNLDYQEREVCWYKQVKKEIQKRGVEGALELIQALYQKEPLFGQGCHDVMHLVGDEAYRQYRTGKHFRLGKETAYCGYGFFHGFIEAMLYTTADYSEVRRFCETLNESESSEIQDQNAMYACYHGIGHATFDVHDPGVWGSETKMVVPAIETCEKVTEGLHDEKVKQCVTGVFNALAIAYGNDQYNLKMKEEDPVWFCRSQSFLYKGPCFIEVVNAWLHSEEPELQNFNFKQGAVFISGLNDKIGMEASIQAFASEITRLKIGSFDANEMVDNCKSLREDLVDNCILGVQEGLFLWGKPEKEHKLAFSFCNANALTQDEKEKCFKYTLRELKVKYPEEKVKTTCESEVETKYQQFCEDESY